jgi:hypothetical protein
MAGRSEDPFEGVSGPELRRMLVEAGDHWLDALSVEAAREARREQAILLTELQRRGEPLEEPAAPASASGRQKPSAAAQERLTAAPERYVAARPRLRPPDMRPDWPKERDTPTADPRHPDPGYRLEPADEGRREPATSARAAEMLAGMAADLDPPRPGAGRPGA